MEKSIYTNKPQDPLNKASTIVRFGEGFIIFAGVIHILVVYSNMIFPDLLSIEMDTLRGSIMGVAFLWLSLGVRKRSSLIAIITLLAWGLDTLLKYAINSGIASGPLMTRSIIAMGLLIGIVGCLMFRSLPKPSESHKESIPKIGRVRIVIFSIFSVIGLGAAVSTLFI